MMTTSGSGAYSIDDAQKVIVGPDKRRYRVSPMEYKLLCYLHANRGRVLSPKEILTNVWNIPGKAKRHQGDVLSVTVSNLRKRVGRNVIDTIQYYGYAVGVDMEV
jgi:DNA-binding response OmpR family regulator